MPKQSVRFLRDYTVRNLRQDHYEEGKVYQLEEGPVRHFMKRGLIEIVKATPKASKK